MQIYINRNNVLSFSLLCLCVALFVHEAFSQNVATTATVPQKAEEFLKRGKDFQHNKKYDLAIEDFTQALNLEPENAEAFFQRGITMRIKSGYSISTRDVDARNDFDNAIFYSPNVANYYYHRGLWRFNENKYDRALEDFTKAIALAPDQYEGYRMRFETFRKLKTFDNALKDVNKAIELQPNGLDLFFARGVLFMDMNDCLLTERAITEFSNIISKTSDFPIVFAARIKAYKKLAECSRKIVEKFDKIADKENEKMSEPINSRATNLAEPTYPKGISLKETVIVDVVISADGSVKEAKMSSGSQVFKNSVEDAALATKFPPTVIVGNPIETSGRLAFKMSPRNVGNGNGGGGLGTSIGDEKIDANQDLNPKFYFVTDQFRVRKYLPGDTKKLEDFSATIWNANLRTTNSAILFTSQPADKYTPVRIISVPKADYTDEARKNKVSGEVTLEVVLLSNGTIGRISVTTGLPNGLTEQAIAAARNIKFSPAIKGGQSVTAIQTVRFVFNLED